MNKDVVADREVKRLRQRLHWYRVAVLILAVVLIGGIMAISSAIFIESQAAREASCGNGFTVRGAEDSEEVRQKRGTRGWGKWRKPPHKTHKSWKKKKSLSHLTTPFHQPTTVKTTTGSITCPPCPPDDFRPAPCPGPEICVNCRVQCITTCDNIPAIFTPITSEPESTDKVREYHEQGQ